MRLQTILGSFPASSRTRAAWGLSLALAAPTLAFGQSAEVQQISYWAHDVETGGQVPLQLDSRVFSVELGFDMFSPSSEQLLDENGGGFINVLFRMDAATPWEWVVQNVYESVPDETWYEQGNIAYEFGLAFLPNGVPLGECDVFITLTEEPIPDEPIVVPGSEQHVPVDPRDKSRNDGGLGGELELPFDYEPELPWENMSVKIGSGAPQASRIRTAQSPRTIGGIDEGCNECAPGAGARSAKYLSGYYGFELKIDSVFEGEPPMAEGPQDLKDWYADVKKTTDAMSDREKYDRKHLLAPYRGLVNQIWGLPIRSTDIGARHSNNVYFNGTTFPPAAEQLKSALAHGHDVEVDYGWKNLNGRTGHHRAMVVSYESEGNMIKLQVCDDEFQGDGTPSVNLKYLLIGPDGSIWKIGFSGIPFKYGHLYRVVKDEYIPRLTDLNDDHRVDGADLALFLAMWSMSPTPDGGEDDCDFNGDGQVNGADLSILLGNWGMTFER